MIERAHLAFPLIGIDLGGFTDTQSRVILETSRLTNATRRLDSRATLSARVLVQNKSRVNVRRLLIRVCMERRGTLLGG